MAVVVQSVGDFTATSGTATTINVDAPAGVQVGDLLVAHLTKDPAAAPVTFSSSWTQIQQTSNGIVSAVFYKIADSGDAAATDFQFSFTSTAAFRAGRIFRITGHNSSSPIGASQIGTASSSTITVGTITPAAANSLIMFFAAAESAGAARTCASYTMVTSPPTYSEHYDEQYDSNNYQMSAASGARPEVTATGNNTATLSGSDPNVGIVVAITPESLSPTSTPATLIATFSIPVPAATNGANSTPALITATFTLNVPTPTAVAPTWSNQSRGTASFTNQDKGSASWSNQEKGSSTWTNQSKS